jgi:CheY-like chemotaxis protein
VSVRILVLSPFDSDRAALRQLLTAEGHEVEVAPDLESGLALAATFCPDALVADAQVPGLDGAATAEAFAAMPQPPRKILLLCPRVGRHPPPPGVYCLTKPIDLDVLHAHLATLDAPDSPAVPRSGAAPAAKRRTRVA